MPVEVRKPQEKGVWPARVREIPQNKEVSLEAKRCGRILVVDDEETIGIGMSEILKDEGFEAAYAVNGRDAVQAIREVPFNLVFMDIVMPGMNGLETFREIKKNRPDTAVVLFTGYFRDAEDVILQGIKEGMIDEFIRKPYFADEIIRSAKKYAVA